MSVLPTLRNVRAAHRRLRARIHRTPLVSSATLSSRAGVDLLFKCENLQKSGSFKYRGAMNAVLSLTSAQRRLGVVTHSSGNHGAALASVAQSLGIAATIVVPRNASAFKRAAIRRYGGTIVYSGTTLKAREKTLAILAANTGAHYIPPYDHPAVIAGQATASVEIVEDCPCVDEVWLPVGGGGLAAGAVVAIGESVQVVGAEPELAKDAFMSLQCGERQAAYPPRTVADGLRASLGVLNFRLLQDYALPVKLVTEAEILAAQMLTMSCLKLLVEPSSAVPVAALLKYGPVHKATGRVVIIVTGGNVEVQQSL